jgi:diaminopimelate decarboxylase
VYPEDSSVSGGSLTVGGCDAVALAREFGTPAYVVAEHDLRMRAREFVAALGRLHDGPGEIVYASKAFPCTAVLRVFAEEGLGCDVASGGELHLALRAGFEPGRLYLHGNAKSEAELAMALEAGVGTVVLDNEQDADRLAALGGGPRLLARVIPGVDADTHEHILTGQAGSKFGMPADVVRALAERVQLAGLHMHIGSQLRSLEPYRRAVAALARVGDFEVYDLGGGLGARYTYDDHPPAVGDYLDALIGAAREHLPPEAEVIIEPGRSMVASAAATLYRVVTVKRGAVTFVAVDGGMGDNLEVALFDQRFEAGIVDRPSAEDGETVTVVGRHCESGDVLVDGVRLDAPRVGDLLGVPATGAYCFTMANNYNGHRRIPVVFADAGVARLVVRRETWADLLSRDVE